VPQATNTLTSRPHQGSDVEWHPTPSRGLQRQLNACVVLELVEKEDERYHTTPIVQTFLVQGQPGYMDDFIAGGTEHYEA
jgi:hypothetical protein